MDLDPAVIIPAIFFTVVAIYFASSFLTKKTEAAAAKKKPKVDYEDDIPPSRALGVAQQCEPRVELPPVIEHQEVKAEVVSFPREEPVIAAPVVEEIGVLEKQPEPEIIPVQQETQVKHVPEPEPEPIVVQEPAEEPITVQEPVTEPVVEPEPVAEPEPVPEPVAEPAPQTVSQPEPAEEEAPELIVEPTPEPMVESAPAPEPVPEPVPAPADQSLPELIPGSTDGLAAPEPVVDAEPAPDSVEHNDVAAEEDKVKFTPGKKQSKFETLMTKEEMEEEQRIELTADFTSL